MEELDYLPFDCDNHYYEALDAFTRHVPPEWHRRCVEWCEINGRSYHVIGGVVSHAVVNPTFDPIAKAGALYKYFRGNPEGRSPMEYLRDREPIPAEYRDRDARLARMDQQGVSSVWLFPTLGVLYEELIKHDTEGLCVLFKGFNRWLEEDWGFAYQNRIYASPYITLADVNWACEELEWALGKGARTVVMRPAPVITSHGPRSPGDEMFDPFWSRVNEAGVTVVVHAGDSGYTSQGYDEDGFGAEFGGPGVRKKGAPTIKAFNIERAAQDWLLTMSFECMYERYPNLRVASVENGSDYLGNLFRKLGQVANKNPWWFKEDPVEMFRRNVWMNPFWEDDVHEVTDLMGADHVIFGSDWPHIEGMPQPLDYVVELKEFEEADQRKILLENTTYLNELQPV